MKMIVGDRRLPLLNKKNYCDVLKIFDYRVRRAAIRYWAVTMLNSDFLVYQPICLLLFKLDVCLSVHR